MSMKISVIKSFRTKEINHLNKIVCLDEDVYVASDALVCLYKLGEAEF